MYFYVSSKILYSGSKLHKIVLKKEFFPGQKQSHEIVVTFSCTKCICGAKSTLVRKHMSVSACFIPKVESGYIQNLSMEYVYVKIQLYIGLIYKNILNPFHTFLKIEISLLFCFFILSYENFPYFLKDRSVANSYILFYMKMSLFHIHS